MFSICIIPLPLSLTLATQEATYNPFYAEVAVKLCNYHNRFKFTFQLAFWDEFKVFDDHTVGVLPGLPGRCYRHWPLHWLHWLHWSCTAWICGCTYVGVQ
jgi:hypothetical protein